MVTYVQLLNNGRHSAGHSKFKGTLGGSTHVASAAAATPPPYCVRIPFQVNVLAYEYSGYGKSDGTVSEDNCYADIRAAYDYLTTQKKTPPKQIVL